LFSGTILSNITYGIPDATKEMAIEAAKQANAHDFICAMPEGYETEVRGVFCR
jgi:ATP-binding cassette subfamily B protein